ncbi:MAG: hypothetical protein ABEJ05_00355 [Haloglomus sp.]
MDYTVQYYDLLLLAIAVAMGGGGAIGVLTPVTLDNAVIGAGLVGALLVGHGLFVNGPVDEPADLTDEVDPEKLGAPVNQHPSAE